MTKPQKLPVEEVRKKIADLLDGSQFRGEHIEITRRGKPAGYLVPPEWWASITEEVAALRRKVKELSAAPPATKEPQAATPPRAQITQAIPEPAEPDDESVELPDEEVKRLIALGRLKTTSEQQERLRRVATTAKSLGRDPDIAQLEALFEMGLLTDADVQR
jgi:prevent-host-death family protein